MSHLCFSPADNENHTKGDSPKTSSASGPQEQLWRGSQAQAQAQAQVQAQAQAQALSSVKLQIQPQNISQRNHTLSRKYCYQYCHQLYFTYCWKFLFLLYTGLFKSSYAICVYVYCIRK